MFILVNYSVFVEMSEIYGVADVFSLAD